MFVKFQYSQVLKISLNIFCVWVAVPQTCTVHTFKRLSMLLLFFHIKSAECLVFGLIPSLVYLIQPTTVAQRVGARLQCEGSWVRIPVRVWMLCIPVLVSLSSVFLVTAVWNRHGLWKKVSLINKFQSKKFCIKLAHGYDNQVI